jgi:hypothetical protein
MARKNRPTSYQILACIAQEAVKKGNRRFLAIGFQQEHPT